jgi:hypothetical protein
LAELRRQAAAGERLQGAIDPLRDDADRSPQRTEASRAGGADPVLALIPQVQPELDAPGLARPRG